MASNSSPFGTQIPKKISSTQLLRGSRTVRIAGLSAAMRVSSDVELQSIAADLIASIGNSTPNWGSVAPAHLRPWLEAAWKRMFEARHRRASARAMEAIVGEWSRLGVELRQRSMPFARQLGEAAAARAIAGGSPMQRLSAVRFAGDSGDVKLLSTAARCVLDSDSRVAGAAEEELIRACAAWAGVEPAELGLRSDFAPVKLNGGLPADPTEFHARLAHLCDSYLSHRRRGVLAGAMAVLSPAVLAYGLSPLAKWLRGSESESHPAMRSLLRKSAGKLSRLRAWEWLGRPAFAAAALDRLVRAESAEEHEVVLEKSHLLHNPRRQERLALVAGKKAGSGGLLPDAAIVSSMKVGARRGLARFTRSVRATSHAEMWLSDAIADEDASVRMSAMMALPAPSVLDFSFDSDAAVARVAAVRWMRAESLDATERARVAANLKRSPHEASRWIGEVESERHRRWGQNELARVAVLQRLRADRVGTIEELRSALREARPEVQSDAVMTARRLCVQREVELELLGLVAVPRDRSGLETSEAALMTVAAAVSALGEAGTPSALEAVRMCLRHPAGRVRSNAAESLTRAKRGRGDLPFAEPRLYESMMEMKDDGHHRARASAIHAVLHAASPVSGGTGFEPVAAGALSQMLTDDRAMHRLAGLWAMERIATSPALGSSVTKRWDLFASRVAELAKGESDERVRGRAVRCARRMLARMRAETLVQETAA